MSPVSLYKKFSKLVHMTELKVPPSIHLPPTAQMSNDILI